MIVTHAAITDFNSIAVKDFFNGCPGGTLRSSITKKVPATFVITFLLYCA